jgi:tight adherence protein C
MPIPLILTLIFLILFSAIFAGLVLFGRTRHPAAIRLAELQGGVRPPKARKLNIRKDKAVETAAGALRALSDLARPSDKKKTRMRAALVQAGYHGEESVKTFAGMKLLGSALFFVLFTCAAIRVRGANPSAMLFLPLAGLAAGYIFPDLVLSRRIRKRQEEIARSLADAIDLLVISVEAGLGLNAALLRVGQDMDVRCRSISEEFGRVNQELRTGVAREKALRNLGDRNKVEDLRIFVGALVLTDRLGTSIADTLRVQADSLRTRLRQKAEEQAAKAGIKMLFPLVFFILPALIIILMGPALISVLKTFNR